MGHMFCLMNLEKHQSSYNIRQTKKRNKRDKTACTSSELNTPDYLLVIVSMVTTTRWNHIPVQYFPVRQLISNL
jgi:hypothetical protein